MGVSTVHDYIDCILAACFIDFIVAGQSVHITENFWYPS